MEKNLNHWLAVIVVLILAVVAINSSGLLQGFAATCPPTQKMIDGICKTYCGNYVCDVGEGCLTCSSDCGACTCIDNDGGVDARVAGTCESSATPLQEFKDNCQGENLLEYYCSTSKGTCEQAIINCVHGCSSGGCV